LFHELSTLAFPPEEWRAIEPWWRGLPPFVVGIVHSTLAHFEGQTVVHALCPVVRPRRLADSRSPGTMDSHQRLVPLQARSLARVRLLQEDGHACVE